MSRRIGRASFACCRARRVDKVTTISMRYHLDEICLHWREDDGKCAFWGPTSLNCCRSCRCDRCRRRRLIGSTCRLNFYTIVFLFSFHFFYCIPSVRVFLSSYIMSEANRGIVAGALRLAPAVPIAIAKCRDANARIVTKYRIYIHIYTCTYSDPR